MGKVVVVIIKPEKIRVDYNFSGKKYATLLDKLLPYGGVPLFSIPNEKVQISCSILKKIDTFYRLKMFESR